MDILGIHNPPVCSKYSAEIEYHLIAPKAGYTSSELSSQGNKQADADCVRCDCVKRDIVLL